MANTPEHNNGSKKQPQSRRRFITWAGEIVAGVSLAGIGIGVLTPKTVLADPDCIQCSCCTFISCQAYGGCPANMPDRATYHAFYGCVNLGQQCPYYVYEACQTDCTPDYGLCGGQC